MKLEGNVEEREDKGDRKAPHPLKKMQRSAFTHVAVEHMARVSECQSTVSIASLGSFVGYDRLLPALG